MAFSESPFESFTALLFLGEAQRIFLSIQDEADLCMEILQKSEINKEIDSNKTQTLRRQVKESLDEASTLRFTLQSADKKIQQEQNSNTLVKQICSQIKESGEENNLESLMDGLGIGEEKDKKGIHSSQPDPLIVIRALVIDSLRHRVQMAWCYDEILEVHRSALMANLISLAHRLTEVALLLQDSQAIQEVRRMLKSLHLDVPNKARIPSLQANPGELKKILTDGIFTMHKTHEDIQRLDVQRNEMKKAVKRLNEKLGDDTSNTNPFTSLRSSPDAPKSKEDLVGRKMVFPTYWKDRR